MSLRVTICYALFCYMQCIIISQITDSLNPLFLAHIIELEDYSSFDPASRLASFMKNDCHNRSSSVCIIVG